VGSVNKRIIVQVGPGKKHEPITKITRRKGAGSIGQAVELLSRKYKAPEFKSQYHHYP
jgi:hypothetical protein